MSDSSEAVTSKISVVVPTRNRAHTLRLVAASYFEQDSVDEVIFVDDAGDDDTMATVSEIAARHPDIRMVVLRNDQRLGAGASRNRGMAAVRNDFVLFCDDDEMIEDGYATLCQRKMIEKGASAVSGRRVYMRDGETPGEALRRFGDGARRVAPYNLFLCEHMPGARFTGDMEIPFTTAVILTRAELVRQFGFDDYYARGTGYREESDYQMNLFVNGHTILQTNDTHSIHLSPSQIRTGGQKVVHRWRRVYWSIFYTDYFYKKYWARYRKRVGMSSPRVFALVCYAAFAIYREYLRPSLSRIASMLLRGRRAASRHGDAVR